MGVGVDPDGSIFLAGKTFGSWDGPPKGTSSDWAVMKLDAGGTSVRWRYQVNCGFVLPPFCAAKE